MCNNKEIENKIISCIMNELSDEFRENLVSGKLYESVILIMINYEKNKSLLDGMIYKRFHEFAIVPKWKAITQDKKGICFVSISDQLIKNFDIDVDRLFQCAYINTLEKVGYEFISFQSFQSGITENDMFDLFCYADKSELELIPDEMIFNNMFILTNSRLEYGSVFLYFNEVLHNIFSKYELNFYIIPSSINELIIMYETPWCCMDGFKNIIHTVNEFVLSENEFLSDNLYYYDGSSKELRVI